MVKVLKPTAVPTEFSHSKKVQKRHSTEQIHLKKVKKAKQACVEEATATHSRNVRDDIEARSKEVQVSVATSEIGEHVCPEVRNIAIQCNIIPHVRSVETQFSPNMIDQGTDTESVNLESTICDEDEQGLPFPFDESTLVSSANDVTFSPQDDDSDKSTEAATPPYSAFVVFW